MHHGTTTAPSVTTTHSFDSERLEEEGLEQREQWEQRQQREGWRREERLRRKQKAGLKR